MGDAVRVVAAVLFDGARRVLISRRLPGRHMAGYWEFPGGKLDQHELPELALRRELREELGIDLQRCHPLLQLRHHYADRTVELEVFVVDESLGEPQGLEGQALKWVSVTELPTQRLLPADGPIIEALTA
jgi:8-oxo-dGTP diphosphatase